VQRQGQWVVGDHSRPERAEFCRRISPFQGFDGRRWTTFPGRCPGLVHCGLSGRVRAAHRPRRFGKTGIAQHQEAEARVVLPLPRLRCARCLCFASRLCFARRVARRFTAAPCRRLFRRGVVDGSALRWPEAACARRRRRATRPRPRRRPGRSGRCGGRRFPAPGADRS